MIYQIVSAEGKHTEQEVRDNLATLYDSWTVANLEKGEERGEWLARLEKDAEFPFEKDDKKDEADSDEDSSDASDEDSSDDPEDSEDDDSDSDSDDSDEGDDEDSVEENKQDLVAELEDVIKGAQELLTQLGDKAKAVSEDAKAKDDTIKDIKDTVTGLSPDDELGDLGGLEDLGAPAGLDAPVPGGPPAGGPPVPKRRPPVPAGGAKRPPGGVRAPGGPSVFTRRKTENVTHSGLNPDGTKTTLVKAASDLEASDDWANYSVVAMRENADGTFSATLQLKV